LEIHNVFSIIGFLAVLFVRIKFFDVGLIYIVIRVERIFESILFLFLSVFRLRFGPLVNVHRAPLIYRLYQDFVELNFILLFSL
jgi:hypothetical protein